MNKKKEEYLRIKGSDFHLFKAWKFKSKFWKCLFDGQLAISPAIFAGLSIACGAGTYFLYKITVGAPIYAITAGILTTTFPYLCYKTPAMMNQVVDEALSYKSFISILQSALRATNSTREALEIVAEERELTPEIRKTMEKVVSDMKLGDSIEESLDRAIQNTENVYFRMALTIVRINHNVGSETSMDALANIKKSMDSTLSNIQLLKDKINTAVMEKALFLGIILSVPVIHSILPKEIIMSFYSQTIWQVVMALMLIYAYIGQFVMDYSASRAMERL
ncbi:MAG: type II secretion system F family protein [Erysipelotrichaceae bacterium]|nr:type II secretion system F family protein [Erysipelotrichaceae bacterium]